MKKPYSLTLFSILLILGLSACQGGQSTGPDVYPAPKDTSQQAAPASSEPADTADLQELIDQYEPPGRVVWQKPEMVINKMGDLSNKVVADLGAGSGFFARRLAQQAKKVIALELDERWIHFMDSIKLVELKPEYQQRFETRLVTPTDSRLKQNEVDIILVVNTYIYLENRIEYMQRLLELLPQGGRVIIVDFKKKRMPIKYPPVRKRLELFEVENELDAAGFSRIISDDQSLDYQYIIVAEK